MAHTQRASLRCGRAFAIVLFPAAMQLNNNKRRGKRSKKRLTRNAKHCIISPLCC